MEANINIDDYDVWDAVAGYVEDMIGDKLSDYVHSDDLECDIASMIDEKELLTADMVCDVTEFKDRVDELEKDNRLMINNEKVMWSAFNEMKISHNQWSAENYKIRDENSELREHVDYLFNRINEFEARTLRGRWDTLTSWIKGKFRGY